jgi:copper chaperone
MKRVELSIDGMSCDHCVASVKRALTAVPGVSDIDVRLGAATLTVDPDQAPIGALIDAVQDAGYEAREGS